MAQFVIVVVVQEPEVVPVEPLHLGSLARTGEKSVLKLGREMSDQVPKQRSLVRSCSVQQMH